MLLESAGLVMIETDRAKAPPSAPAAEEPQHLGRPRRERPKPPAQDEELEQVETKKVGCFQLVRGGARQRASTMSSTCSKPSGPP